jgi:threonylcarbamoyladenosine tRNA methylthiotransferase MtaB
VSKTFHIITLGCKVNQYESACLREALLQAGWLEVPKGVKAALNVVNTCIVTQSASVSRVRRSEGRSRKTRAL